MFHVCLCLFLGLCLFLSIYLCLCLCVNIEKKLAKVYQTLISVGSTLLLSMFPHVGHEGTIVLVRALLSKSSHQKIIFLDSFHHDHIYCHHLFGTKQRILM